VKAQRLELSIAVAEQWIVGWWGTRVLVIEESQPGGGQRVTSGTAVAEIKLIHAVTRATDCLDMRLNHRSRGDGMQRVRSSGASAICSSPTACLQGSSKLPRPDLWYHCHYGRGSTSFLPSSPLRDARGRVHTRYIAVVPDLSPPVVNMALSVFPAKRWCGARDARQVTERRTGAQHPR
jgi:hypothetical protein